MYDAIKPVKHAHGGVKAPHKKFTAEQATVKMPPPDKVYIAMQQHIGAPCKPLVKKGDHVLTSKYSGTEVKVDGKDYIIVRQNDILAIVE